MMLKPTPGNAFLVTALATPVVVISIWLLLKQNPVLSALLLLILITLIIYGLVLSRSATRQTGAVSDSIQPDQVQQLLQQTQNLIGQAKSQKAMLDQFRQLTDQIPVPVWIAEKDGKLVYVNTAWQSQHLGFEEGQPLPESELARLEIHDQALKSGESRSKNIDLGDEGSFTIHCIPLGGGIGCCGFAIRTSNGNRLTDAVTQLGNRLFARHWLDQQIYSGKAPALLAISTSAESGTDDLPQIAEELSHLATHNLVPARISEHHIGLLVADVNDPREILELVQKVSDLLSLTPQPAASAPAFGLARHPEQGNNGADLIHHALADLATTNADLH